MTHRLLLVRHGESNTTVARTIGGFRTCRGLSPLGRKQAEVVQERNAAVVARDEAAAERQNAPQARDKAEAVNSFLLKDLLSVADNLRRALEALPEAEVTGPKTKSMLEGVAATERELLAVFERNGLKRVDPRGDRFEATGNLNLDAQGRVGGQIKLNSKGVVERLGAA